LRQRDVIPSPASGGINSARNLSGESLVAERSLTSFGMTQERIDQRAQVVAYSAADTPADMVSNPDAL